MNENTVPPIEAISDADWAETPDSVKRYLLARIEQLEQQYAELKAENALLRERVQQNRENSSKPPSQDLGKGFKPKQAQGQGKRRGAQFGHVGAVQDFYPVEVCQTEQDYYPERCVECGRKLDGRDPAPYRVQQVEIPAVQPDVQEHRYHRKGWLWVMVTPLVSYFAIALSRSSEVCQQLLGDAFAGIVGSDRCGAYTGLA